MELKPRVTLADVAAVAGVSKMTASRALRGAPDVSRENIEKVAQAARETGYVGNPLATAFSNSRSNLIGVVVPSLNNIVFAEVLSGIAEGIEGSGLQPMFGVTEYDLNTEVELIKSLLSWNPAGLIVTGLDQSEEAQALLGGAAIPIVQIMDTDGAPVGSAIGFSHFEAGREMAEALVASGRRRFGYVGCGLARDLRAKRRLEGFRAGLQAVGLDLLGEIINPELSSTKAGKQLTSDLVSAHPELDCIYYSNDDVAVGGVFYCLKEGIDLEHHLLLAGFNGLEMVKSLPVQIATTKTPRREIGLAAGRMLAGAKGGGRLASGSKTCIPTRLSIPSA